MASAPWSAFRMCICGAWGRGWRMGCVRSAVSCSTSAGLAIQVATLMGSTPMGALRQPSVQLCLNIEHQVRRRLGATAGGGWSPLRWAGG